MFNLTYKRIFAVIMVTASVLLTACGSGDKVIDDIIDDVETKDSAHISYINNTQDVVDFYLKSTVYNESVYADKFLLVELAAAETSTAKKHEWISGAKESKFAIENAINQQGRTSQTLDLNNGDNYWTIAWQQQSIAQIFVIKRSPSNTGGVYKIRIFSSENSVVKNSYDDTIITSTQAGEVSDAFALENCADLTIADMAIDICQVGQLGQSYLVVIDIATGTASIVRE